MTFPAREMILSPWLPEQGLTMIYAERGIGKTWVGLNVGHVVSGGGNYLGWQATRARRVVYIDGEMPSSVLKDRYATIVAGSEIDPPEENFWLVASDLQTDGLPDLSDPAHQRFYDDEIRDADLIIVDNLSTICPSHRENEADSWAPVQAWCLRQRAAGKSVLLSHHAGKSGAQRGTSQKETC
jgi:RecA-family ATPase